MMAAADPNGESSQDDTIDMGVLPQLIGFNLRCAQVAVFQHFHRTAGSAEISPPQLGALIRIESNPGISQSAIAGALRFDRSTLVQIIDRLEERGFVGRESEMARLQGSLDLAKMGRGRVAFLVGEPGIGKTSTVEKLGAEAEAAGVQWLAGRCYEGEGAPAFWPWLQ